MEPIILWTKPVCMQCNMVKSFLIAKITGETALSSIERDLHWAKLERAGKVLTHDITSEEHIQDLEYFKTLGYMAAPITEFKGHAVPGFIPAELATIFEEWEHQHGG